MNTLSPSCSTAGNEVRILPKRRAARGRAYTRAVPRQRERSPLARANSDGRTDGRRRFPPHRSLIFLCVAKAGAALDRKKLSGGGSRGSNTWHQLARRAFVQRVPASSSLSARNRWRLRFAQRDFALLMR